MLSQVRKSGPGAPGDIVLFQSSVKVPLLHRTEDAVNPLADSESKPNFSGSSKEHRKLNCM